ncbi:hypothetical protein G6F31_018155 [Rhizopus arrhizus]|nr:hypothetical protein G6F31_018155 [Rhizopus arrhizus]
MQAATRMDSVARDAVGVADFVAAHAADIQLVDGQARVATLTLQQELNLRLQGLNAQSDGLAQARETADALYNAGLAAFAVPGTEYEPIIQLALQNLSAPARGGHHRVRLATVAFLRRRFMGRHPCHHLCAPAAPAGCAYRRAPQSWRIDHLAAGPAAGHPAAGREQRFAGERRREPVPEHQVGRVELRRLFPAGDGCVAAVGA